MNAFRQRQAWFWFAIAAIVVALVALLVPHGHAHNASQPEWLALLPVFFVGLIAPLCLLPLLANLSLGRTPAAPPLVPSFQRPPPSRA